MLGKTENYTKTISQDILCDTRVFLQVNWVKQEGYAAEKRVADRVFFRAKNAKNTFF